MLLVTVYIRQHLCRISSCGHQVEWTMANVNRANCLQIVFVVLLGVHITYIVLVA